jgi:hypothetical protein
MTDDAVLDRVRAICLALPDTSERLSHGTPHWFAGKRNFVSYWDDHHQDGRLALWCAAPEGAQRMLCEADPEHFFIPPYVGFRGWLGVHLNRGLDWDEIAGVIETAHRTIATKKR